MALTPAERQRRRRERLKKEGTSRRDWILEPDELRMLGKFVYCVNRGEFHIRRTKSLVC